MLVTQCLERKVSVLLGMGIQDKREMNRARGGVGDVCLLPWACGSLEVRHPALNLLELRGSWWVLWKLAYAARDDGKGRALLA